LDRKLRCEPVGGRTVVSKEPASVFCAFGGRLKRRMLHLKNNTMIVQTCRTSGWGKDEPDIVLVPLFRGKDGGTELERVHANLPDRQADEPGLATPARPYTL
jgi:hypothetical protein